MSSITVLGYRCATTAVVPDNNAHISPLEIFSAIYGINTEMRKCLYRNSHYHHNFILRSWWLRHLMLHMLYDYKCNIHKTFLSSWRKIHFVTVKKPFVTVMTFWFIMTTTNINQMHEVAHNTLNNSPLLDMLLHSNTSNSPLLNMLLHSNTSNNSSLCLTVDCCLKC
jgi:hypothetical protein